MAIGETTPTQSPTTEDVILEVRDATVRFGMDRGQAVVLDNVSININRHEVLGIVGESGSGKSMFADALLDSVRDPGQTTGQIIYHPDEGDPFDILSLSQGELKNFRWHEIGMVFQGALESFNPTMKIGDHFVETIHAHSLNESDRMGHARELLAELHLDPERVLDAYPHELSGGMKQRALIALALLLEPEVLVMDEPTSALDLLMQRAIITMLRDLQDTYDLTIVFITHDMPVLSGLADRIAVMYAFELVEIGQTEEVVLDASHPYTRALMRAVPSLDMGIDELQVIRGSSPDPVNVPSGCSYHPRCPLADDRCEIEDPDLVEIDDGHRVACFYYDQAADAVPYEISSDEWSDTE